MLHRLRFDCEFSELFSNGGYFQLLLSDKNRMEQKSMARRPIFSRRVFFLRFTSPLSQKEMDDGVSRKLIQVWIPSPFRDD